MHDLRVKLRVSNLIRDAVAQGQGQRSGLGGHGSRVISRWEQFLAFKRKLELCEERGWSHAARILRVQFWHLLADFRLDIEHLEKMLSRREPAIPAAREIFSEIEAVEREFGGWAFDNEAQTLSVTTGAIELEGISLGHFEIRLELSRTSRHGRQLPYTVVALEPNPASSNDAVTHPHVKDEMLCEGDAAGAIKAAFEGGRICDFFLLVDRVLHTYNPDSPYVKLAEWAGEPCYDCGCAVESEGLCFCEGCEHLFCTECLGSCRDCGVSLCGDCLDPCFFCEEPLCGSCFKRCKECKDRCCGACLKEELCPECFKEDDDEEDETDEQEHDQGRGQEQGQAAEGQCA